MVFWKYLKSSWSRRDRGLGDAGPRCRLDKHDQRKMSFSEIGDTLACEIDLLVMSKVLLSRVGCWQWWVDRRNVGEVPSAALRRRSNQRVRLAQVRFFSLSSVINYQGLEGAIKMTYVQSDLRTKWFRVRWKSFIMITDQNWYTNVCKLIEYVNLNICLLIIVGMID